MIREQDTPIKVPAPSRTKRKNKRRKVQKLREGNPSTTPLAAPPPPANSILVVPDAPVETTLINFKECQVLASFKEPLGQLLEHDDLPGAKADFFALVEDIVTVREHFHLHPPSQSPTTTKTKNLDLQDPQAAQKCYAWTRR
ncbi:hypothetical protein TNIN_354111 [Trichonephila inaurata madagascariensis]|uniref:Uncharacterized protein n=1 Tax=Trichonephila inaurata madagascariensis TaxID=2747483 RepID=A0A8X6XSQ2_9ARAC|nr:hypothetical protein TNIN_354111 [Trichonephila inaurata madagascariensis]